MEQLTAGQVADRLGLSVWTVHRMIKDGRLPGRKIGTVYVIDADALDDYQPDDAA